jgi:acyl-CoA thioester hydrolase
VWFGRTGCRRLAGNNQGLHLPVHPTMPRIQFTLPDRFIFAADMQIYISHVNQGGHLDNAQLLTLVSEARVRFFKTLGYTEGNVAGHPIVVGDIVAQYKSEGFHGETMRVSMVPQDFNAYGFDLVFQMACLDTGREVARGKIGIVFIDKATRKVAPVPQAFFGEGDCTGSLTAGDGQPRAPLNGQPPWLPGLSHEPQGLAGMRMASDPSAGLAMTDSSLARSVVWHCGHSGTVLLLTRASNSWPQPLQAYS